MDGRISNFQQIASVRRYTINGGKGDGLKVIDCDNGNIRFLLNESKALDMMQLFHKGQNISFLSKNAFTAQEFPFLRRFEGGMIYTCGIDNIGRKDGFELHGNFHNLKAEIIKAECSEDGITVEGIICDSELFGKNLAVKRKIFSAINSNSVTVSDTLINQGFTDQKYCLLYHINAGYPMLDEGCKIVADIKESFASSEWAEKNKKTMLEIEKPIPNNDETCYYLKLNEPKISLVNDKIKKKFTVEYSLETLPCFLEWKSMASGDYALGLEPCTTEIRSFELSDIKADEKKEFFVKLTVEEI